MKRTVITTLFVLFSPIFFLLLPVAALVCGGRTQNDN